MELTFSTISLGVSLLALLVTLIAWKRSSVETHFAQEISDIEIQNRAHEQRMKSIELEWDKYATALKRVEGKVDRSRRGRAPDDDDETSPRATNYEEMTGEEIEVAINGKRGRL